MGKKQKSRHQSKSSKRTKRSHLRLIQGGASPRVEHRGRVTLRLVTPESERYNDNDDYDDYDVFSFYDKRFVRFLRSFDKVEAACRELGVHAPVRQIQAWVREHYDTGVHHRTIKRSRDALLSMAEREDEAKDSFSLVADALAVCGYCATARQIQAWLREYKGRRVALRTIQRVKDNLGIPKLTPTALRAETDMRVLSAIAAITVLGSMQATTSTIQSYLRERDGVGTSQRAISRARQRIKEVGLTAALIEAQKGVR